jgi:hypothetical protein
MAGATERANFPLMKATLGALAAMLILVGCSDEKDPETYGYPAVESRYTLDGGTVECRGTVDETWTPEGPIADATEYRCTWERVTVGGSPTCVAILTFTRPDTSSTWTLGATFRTSATACN